MPLFESSTTTHRNSNYYSPMTMRGVGFAQLYNNPGKEDALMHFNMVPQHLTPRDNFLDDRQLAYCLWTAHKHLSEDLERNSQSGTTASTVYYDGVDTFFCATVGDSSSFAIAFDAHGMVLGVVRLNNRLHKISNLNAKFFIQYDQGPEKEVLRTDLTEHTSRSLGDADFKTAFKLSSNAEINIIKKAQLARRLQTNEANIASLKILSTTVDFTRNRFLDDRLYQEQYLLVILQSIPRVNILSERRLAIALAHSFAKDKAWAYDITVLVNRVGNAFMQGVYNGHHGPDAANFAAQNMVDYFTKQCQLSSEVYAAQTYSVNNCRAQFSFDNKTIQLPAEPLVTKRKEVTLSDIEGSAKRRRIAAAGQTKICFPAFFDSNATGSQCSTSEISTSICDNRDSYVGRTLTQIAIGNDINSEPGDAVSQTTDDLDRFARSHSFNY